MSGGVDSSVAALLLKQRGCECAGVMMKLFDAVGAADAAGAAGAVDADGAAGAADAVDAADAVSAAGAARFGSFGASCRAQARNGQASGLGAIRAVRRACCSLEDAEDARGVANRLGMPFYVFNFKAGFQAEVIDRFVRAYRGGETPNPCIDCNRFMKFERLLRRAETLGYDYIATGHYARVEHGAGGARHLLKKGADASKDQSYVLYAMTQRQLGRTLLPLGGMLKEQVRELALLHGFANAKKRDSQDICFVPDGNYAGFIEAYTGEPAQSGRFLDLAGNAVGTHGGAIRYTIGQRRGLGLAMPAPVYVCGKSMADNTVTVGGEGALFSKSLTARDINFIPFARLDAPMRVKAKTRYRQAEQWAWLEQAGDDEIRVAFDTPQRAVTAGQAVVLYDGDVVVGGGTIA
jgi:tRNA-specific 2-thiouridylase